MYELPSDNKNAFTPIKSYDYSGQPLLVIYKLDASKL
jgi:hypothetical protein